MPRMCSVRLPRDPVAGPSLGQTGSRLRNKCCVRICVHYSQGEGVRVGVRVVQFSSWSMRGYFYSCVSGLSYKDTRPCLCIALL